MSTPTNAHIIQQCKHCQEARALGIQTCHDHRELRTKPDPIKEAAPQPQIRYWLDEGDEADSDYVDVTDAVEAALLLRDKPNLAKLLREPSVLEDTTRLAYLLNNREEDRAGIVRKLFNLSREMNWQATVEGSQTLLRLALLVDEVAAAIDCGYDSEALQERLHYLFNVPLDLHVRPGLDTKLRAMPGGFA